MKMPAIRHLVVYNIFKKNQTEKPLKLCGCGETFVSLLKNCSDLGLNVGST